MAKNKVLHRTSKAWAFFNNWQIYWLSGGHISKENSFLLLPPVSLSVMWLESENEMGYTKKDYGKSEDLIFKPKLKGSQHFGKHW